MQFCESWSLFESMVPFSPVEVYLIFGACLAEEAYCERVVRRSSISSSLHLCLGSDQDRGVLHLIPIWACLWPQYCSICTLSHSSLVPICLPAWQVGFLVWPWAFLLPMDLMDVFWTLGWSWWPSLGLISTLTYWLSFLASFQRGCCPCLPCDAQLLSCLLQGNLPLLLPVGAKGKESQHSLNPTICIILAKFLLFDIVTQSLNLSACKWPWSCISKYLWVLMFSLFPASHV